MDNKIEKLENYLLKLTEDIATVKAKLELMDDVKEAIDNMQLVKSEIEILRLTVSTLENRVNRLEEEIAEETKYKSRSVMKTIITILATIVSGFILEKLI